MNNEVLELIIEVIIRTSGYNSYEEYNNEELREQFHQTLRKENTNASSKNI